MAARVRPLTRRMRQMLRDAYEFALANPGGKTWTRLMSPAPRIGDLRVLNGLALRGLMTDGNNGDAPHGISVWPRFIRITDAGIIEWERVIAQRTAGGSGGA